MPISFTNRVRVPADVLISDVNGESVLLNLQTESYFGLDEVGTRFWAALTAADSIQSAFEVLVAEFDVEPERLRQDLEEWLGHVTSQGLLEVQT